MRTVRDVLRFYETPPTFQPCPGNPMEEVFLGQVLPPNVTVVVREQGRAMMDLHAYYGDVAMLQPDASGEEAEEAEAMGDAIDSLPLPPKGPHPRSARVTLNV